MRLAPSRSATLWCESATGFDYKAAEISALALEGRPVFERGGNEAV